MFGTILRPKGLENFALGFNQGLNPGPGVWTFGESGTRKTLGASYGPRGQKLRFLTKEYRELAFGFGAPLPGLEGGKPATSAGRSSPPT